MSQLTASKAPFYNRSDHCHNDEEGHDSAKSSDDKQIVSLVAGKTVHLKMGERRAVALSALNLELVKLLDLPQPQE